MTQLNLSVDVKPKDQKKTNASPKKKANRSSKEGFLIIMFDESKPYLIYFCLGMFVISLLLFFAIYLKIVGTLFPDKQWLIDQIVYIDLIFASAIMVVKSICAFFIVIINTISSIVTKVGGVKDKIKEYKFNNENKNKTE